MGNVNPAMPTINDNTAELVSLSPERTGHSMRTFDLTMILEWIVSAVRTVTQHYGSGPRAMMGYPNLPKDAHIVYPWQNFPQDLPRIHAERYCPMHSFN